jgi:gluconate kinase
MNQHSKENLEMMQEGLELSQDILMRWLVSLRIGLDETAITVE